MQLKLPVAKLFLLWLMNGSSRTPKKLSPLPWPPTVLWPSMSLINSPSKKRQAKVGSAERPPQTPPTPTPCPPGHLLARVMFMVCCPQHTVDNSYTVTTIHKWTMPKLVTRTRSVTKKPDRRWRGIHKRPVSSPLQYLPTQQPLDSLLEDLALSDCGYICSVFCKLHKA